MFTLKVIPWVVLPNYFTPFLIVSYLFSFELYQIDKRIKSDKWSLIYYCSSYDCFSFFV